MPLHGRTAEDARTAADTLAATADVSTGRLSTYAADFTRLDEVETLAHKMVAEHAQQTTASTRRAASRTPPAPYRQLLSAPHTLCSSPPRSPL